MPVRTSRKFTPSVITRLLSGLQGRWDNDHSQNSRARLGSMAAFSCARVAICRPGVIIKHNRKESSMPYYFFIWTDENASHIAEHGITQDEFEAVVCNPESMDVSRSSGLPVAFGFTESERQLACVYKILDDHEIFPVTAYEVE